MKAMSASKSNMCIKVGNAQEKMIKIKNCVFPWNSPAHWYAAVQISVELLCKSLNTFSMGEKSLEKVAC